MKKIDVSNISSTDYDIYLVANDTPFDDITHDVDTNTVLKILLVYLIYLTSDNEIEISCIDYA